MCFCLIEWLAYQASAGTGTVGLIDKKCVLFVWTLPILKYTTLCRPPSGGLHVSLFVVWRVGLAGTLNRFVL